MAIVASGQVTLTDLNDARQLLMYVGASQSKTVVYDGVSTYTPNYASTNQVLTPQLFIAGTSTDVANQVSSCRWYYKTNGAGSPIEITTDNQGTTYALTKVETSNLYTLTIKSNIVASNTSMTYICELTYPDPSIGLDVTSKAEIEILKITNGASGTRGSDAIVGVLSNESSHVPANALGEVTTLIGAESELTIYKGIKDDTANWTIKQTVVGATVTPSGTPANKKATITSMTADVATVTFTATRSGYASIVKVFTLTKVKQGEDGSFPTTYDLVLNTVVLALNQAKTAYNPTTIDLSARSQTGDEFGEYSGRFKIYESTDGIAFTLKYTSSIDELKKSYKPTPYATSPIKAIKVELYLSGGTDVLADVQTIRVVADGTDAIYANVWNPDGNTIKNSSGNVTAQCDLYNGTKTISASSYKWYIQDPTATTSSGGDEDGGNGWRLLTSAYNVGITGYTTFKIKIPASVITGTESFKCVATYNGTKYNGVTTVVDLSDPIVVRLDGASTFKNGQGTVTIRATLLQAGTEIDATGNGGYTYTWSIYDTNNVKTSFSKTGKTITVSGTDINGIGNLVCDVTKS